MKRITLLMAVVVIACYGTAWAETPSQEELAAKVEQLQKEVAQLKAQELAGTDITSPAVAPSSTKSFLDKAFEKVYIHGYVSQGYLHSTENNYLFSNTKKGDFQFNEMALNVYSQLSEKISVGIQLFARDLGTVGNDAVELDYAFGDYHFSDAIGLRAGRIRIPWGLYGEIRDVDVARTSIFMPQSVYLEEHRDVAYGIVGFGFYGLIPIDGAGSLDYEVQTGSQNIDERNSAIGQMFESSWTQPGLRSHHGTHYIGRVIWNTPLDGLRVGGSYFYFDKMTMDGRTTSDPYLVDTLGIPAGSAYRMTLRDVAYGMAFAEYSSGDLVLAAEYMRNHSSSTSSVYQQAGWGMFTSHTDGGYVSARYRFSHLFELGSYYSAYWPNRLDRDGDGYAMFGWPDYQAWSKDLALSLRFDVHKGVLFKLEGHYMDGTANLSSLINDVATAKKNAYLFAAKASFTF